MDGAGALENDFNGFVFLRFFHEAHQAKGVEELGGDVGGGASTLGGDAIADQEKQELGEELVDFIGGMEVRDLIEKFGGKVVGILFGCAETGVAERLCSCGFGRGEDALGGNGCPRGALLQKHGGCESPSQGLSHPR
jgi:hypothetical protein